MWCSGLRMLAGYLLRNTNDSVGAIASLQDHYNSKAFCAVLKIGHLVDLVISFVSGSIFQVHTRWFKHMLYLLPLVDNFDSRCPHRYI